MQPEKQKKILDKLNRSGIVFQENYKELDKDISTLLKEKIVEQKAEMEELHKELEMLNLQFSTLS